MPDEPVPAAPPGQLLDVRAVAARLDCSAQHVRRLAKTGRMPSPVHIGDLFRWRSVDIDNWIGAGCPPVETCP